MKKFELIKDSNKILSDDELKKQSEMAMKKLAEIREKLFGNKGK